MKREKKYKFSIRLTVVTVFILATVLTAAIGIGLQYHFSRAMAINSALVEYQLAASGTANYLNAIDSKAAETTRILSKFPRLVANGWISPDSRQLFAEVMRSNPVFYAIYIGFPDGNFYELVNLNTDESVRRQLRASPDDRWVVITVAGNENNRFRRFEYYGRNFKLRISRQEHSDYDASKRLWFVHAQENEVYKTMPYLFQHLQAPGQTYSTVIPSTRAVLAIDIALSSLSAYLKKQPLSRNSEIYIFRGSGEIIAANTLSSGVEQLPPAAPLKLTEPQKNTLARLGRIRISNETDWPPIDYAVAGEPRGYSVDLIRLAARMIGLKIEFVNGYNWPDLVAMFKNKELEMLQPVFSSEENEHLGVLSRPILKLPYALATRSGDPRISDLRQLSGKTLAMPKGWSIIAILREDFPDINIVEVESTRQALEAILAGDAYATLDSSVILHYTAEHFFIQDLKFHEHLDVSDAGLPDELHLLLSREYSQLMPLLNEALARIDIKQSQALKAKWFADQGSIRAAENVATVPYPQLIALSNQSSLLNRLNKTTINGREFFVFVTGLLLNKQSSEYFAAVIPTWRVLAASLEKVKVSILITGACLLLLLPVSWLFASPIVHPVRRLATENEKIKNRKYDEVEQIESSIIEIQDLSDSITDMAKAIKQHELEQKELMESFIRLIAQAIDDKSPYTAGHCARVPVLALMLAKAAERMDSGPFTNFSFQSEDELREFRIAAWLHDCGKITTPEFIVDKSTKLETIYNRIHEIRMRFEVLWRDAEIGFLKRLAAEPEQADRLKTELADQKARLTADFEFIARTNIGGEFLEWADSERLKSLSEITWERHFDDRLGLSQIELQRLVDSPAPLPATEQLLSDKPEHIIERVHNNHHDPKFGIRMDIPEHQYNLGELYNLSVSRGTLTAEDRFKINEHMISTIKMLENLPFPKELARVPKYASTHHETLTGTGYPRKLSADDLSIPERILAVADIFEALTAADRPYKDAKPVSAAIDILYNKVLDNHVDRDVFELLLTSGVLLEYGERFLSRAQLDRVDTDRYLRHPGEDQDRPH